MEFAGETVALFNLALDFFERIQLARDFQKDFAIHQIKLDIIQLRLSRWGEVTAINSQNENAQDSGLGQQAKGLFYKIKDTFQTAQKEANSMRPESNEIDEAPLDPKTHIDDQFERLRTNLRQRLRKSTSDLANFGQRIKWAFYKKRHFEEFVQDISALIDSLEQLLPENARKQLEELSKEECEDLGKPALKILQKIVGNCDPWLKLAVDEELKKGPYAGVTFTNQGTNNGQQSAVHNGSVEIQGSTQGDGDHHIVHIW